MELRARIAHSDHLTQFTCAHWWLLVYTYKKTFLDFTVLVFDDIYFDFDYDYVYGYKQAGWRTHVHGLILYVHMVVEPVQL